MENGIDSHESKEVENTENHKHTGTRRCCNISYQNETYCVFTGTTSHNRFELTIDAVKIFNFIKYSKNLSIDYSIMVN